MQAHAQLATLHYLSAQAQASNQLQSLTLSLRHFCRSIELNEYYLRGYYGLKLVTKKLIPLLSEAPTSSKKNTTEEEDED